jgi:hypothetical protein
MRRWITPFVAEESLGFDHHPRDLGHCRVDVGDGLGAHDTGEHEDFDAEPDRGRVDDRSVAADRSAGFEVADSSLAARNAEVDPVGKVPEALSAQERQTIRQRLLILSWIWPSVLTPAFRTRSNS